MANILGQEGDLYQVQLDDGRVMALPGELAQEQMTRESETPTYADAMGMQPPMPQVPQAPQAPPPAPVDPAQAAGLPPEVTPAAAPGPAPVPAEIPQDPVEQDVAAFDPARMATQGGSLSVTHDRSVRGGRMANFPAPPDNAEEQAAIDQAYRLQEAGLTEERRVAESAGKIDEDKASAAAVHALRSKIDHDSIVQRATRVHEQDEADIDEAMREIPQADPGRVFTNAGTFGTIGHIISAAISGWFNPGGPNAAIEMAAKLIDQDVRAQQMDIETARENVYRMENKAERNERWFDKRFRDNETQQAFRWAAVEAEFAKRAAALKSPIARANWMKEVAGARLKKNEARMASSQRRFENRLAVETQVQNAYNAQQSRNLEAARIQLGREELEARKQAASAEAGDGVHFNDPNTRESVRIDPKTALTKDQIGEIGVKQQARRSIGEDLKHYYDLLEKVGRRPGVGKNTRFGSEDAALLEGAFQRVKGKIRLLMSGKAVTETEGKELISIIGDPPGTFGQLPNKRIKQLLQSFGDEEDGEFNALKATKEDGTPYRPGNWYLDLPAPKARAATSTKDLSTVIRTEAEPAEVLGATEGFAQIVKMPGGRAKALEENPRLLEETHLGVLKAMSEAKSRGDMKTVEALKTAYEDFQDAFIHYHEPGVGERATGLYPQADGVDAADQLGISDYLDLQN